MEIEQTNKILKVLNDYGLRVVDMAECPSWINQPIVSEEYFNEKINEAIK